MLIVLDGADESTFPPCFVTLTACSADLISFCISESLLTTSHRHRLPGSAPAVYTHKACRPTSVALAHSYIIPSTNHRTDYTKTLYIQAIFAMARYEQYHVFSIPQHLLDTLVPRNIGTLPSAVPEAPVLPSRPASPFPAPAAPAGARACNICLGVTFADVDEQRTHFRSDMHRYNVKMRMSGANAVSEVQFAQLADGTSTHWNRPAFALTYRYRS